MATAAQHRLDLKTPGSKHLLWEFALQTALRLIVHMVIKLITVDPQYLWKFVTTTVGQIAKIHEDLRPPLNSLITAYFYNSNSKCTFFMDLVFGSIWILLSVRYKNKICWSLRGQTCIILPLSIYCFKVVSKWHYYHVSQSFLSS